MTKNFEGLLKKMSPTRRACVERRVQDELVKMPLHELRRARGITQEMLAESLRMKQATVSKIERQTDMYVSTLSRLIKAMGGEMEIVVHFPEERVAIDNVGGPKGKGQRNAPKGLSPGTRAPVSGKYRLINARGRGTECERTVTRGAPLPTTPKRGQTWRLVSQVASGEKRAQRHRGFSARPDSQ